MQISKVEKITKIIFRAFDQTCVEYFGDKDDVDIHSALSKICNTYVMVSKETGTVSLEFQPITEFLELNRASA